MKRKNIIIGVLLLIIVVLIFICINRAKKNYYMQAEIDNQFKNFFYTVLGAYNKDYDNMSIENMVTEYTEALNGVKTANEIHHMTSYTKENSKLNKSLYALYYYMVFNPPWKGEIESKVHDELYRKIVEFDFNSVEDSEDLINYLREITKKSGNND